jgi:hypothetical protein
MVGQFIMTRRERMAREQMSGGAFYDDSHRMATISGATRAPLSRLTRPELPDRESEDMLQTAEREIIGIMLEAGIDPITARGVLGSLTRNDARACLGIILDFTPSKLG